MKKFLGLFALGALLMLGAPAQRAHAVSLINPGIAAAVQDESRLTTEVRWHHHHGWRHHRWHHRHWGWRHHRWHHRHWGWRHHRWHHRHWGWRHHRGHHRHWRW